jgi:hypothetical protein
MALGERCHGSLGEPVGGVERGPRHGGQARGAVCGRRTALIDDWAQSASLCQSPLIPSYIRGSDRR